MKKSILFAAAVLAVCACSTPLPKTIGEYAAATKSMDEKFEETAKAISADSTLSKAVIESKLNAAFDDYKNEYLKFAGKVMEENKGSEFADEVFKDVLPVFGEEEFSKYLPLTSEALQADGQILSMKKLFEAQKSTAVGNKFIDFEVDGVKFSDYVGCGKVVLVDFWASWCGPCKREIPNIAAVWEKYASDKFDVLSVAVWDEPEATAEAAAEHGVKWNQIVNAQKEPTDIYGIQGIPQIMLFGADGTILKRDLRGDAIEAAVKEALGL